MNNISVFFGRFIIAEVFARKAELLNRVGSKTLIGGLIENALLKFSAFSEMILGHRVLKEYRVGECGNYFKIVWKFLQRLMQVWL